MPSGMTNHGVHAILGGFFRGEALPTNMYVVLITNAVTPTVDTNTLSDLTEINAGNGYTQYGFELDRNSTDFPDWVEDDSGDKATLQIKDIVWTASGGPIPASGTDAYHAVITDDNVTEADRIVYGFADLTGPISVSDGQPLTLQDLEFRLTTA